MKKLLFVLAALLVLSCDKDDGPLLDSYSCEVLRFLTPINVTQGEYREFYALSSLEYWESSFIINIEIDYSTSPATIIGPTEEQNRILMDRTITCK